MTEQRIEVFTFGEAESVTESSAIFDYIEAWTNGDWYEPPVSFDFLSKYFRASPHHSSAVYIKRNLLQSCYVPNAMLSRGEFAKWALDYIVFGNGYLEKVRSATGKTLQLKRVPAKYTRRGIKPEKFFHVYGYGEHHEFRANSVFHLLEPDINQEIYGLPEYLASVQSGLLNESATIFRRRYYLNGSHAGFILYINDPSQEEQDIDAIREALKNSKGPGNFRNLFMYAPGGKKDGVQVIPVGQAMAKDEFANVKNASEEDVLASHRIPAALIGTVPKNAGGLGDIEKATSVFFRNEIKPLQERFRELNDWIGEEVVRFEVYE